MQTPSSFKQKHKQRDSYIDKSKYKHPHPSSSTPNALLEQQRQKSWQPKHSKQFKYSKSSQRSQMIQKSQTQKDQFSSLSINLIQFLDYNDKVLCKCNRKIKYYCTKCMTTNEELEFPKVELEMNILILHHPEEKASKSTGLPLCFLSPQITHMMFKEDTEEFEEGTYVLYPHKDSIRVSELKEKPKVVIAVDCTWYQTGPILRELEKQKGLKYIRLEEYETKFWRYQHHGEQALSTAEAVYYFAKEYYVGWKGMGEEETKWLDNLLFLFGLNKKIIGRYYKDKIEGEEKTQREKKEIIDNEKIQYQSNQKQGEKRKQSQQKQQQVQSIVHEQLHIKK